MGLPSRHGAVRPSGLLKSPDYTPFTAVGDCTRTVLYFTRVFCALMGKEPSLAPAPCVTGRRRASGKQVSSRHFSTRSKAADGVSGHAAQLPNVSDVQRAWRSDYFVSSPDSSSGSASTFDWGSAFTERAFRAFKACELYESLGVRHICAKLCYLRAYEPARKWHALRSAVARAGASTRVLSGWSVRMDGGPETGHSWRIHYISPDVGVRAS